MEPLDCIFGTNMLMYLAVWPFPLQEVHLTQGAACLTPGSLLVLILSEQV